MTKEQYYEMIRLKIDVHGYYGASVKYPLPSEDERNKMFKKYMKLRNLYRKCKGVIK